jgi:NADH-quinone oxidoreductase subunit N
MEVAVGLSDLAAVSAEIILAATGILILLVDILVADRKKTMLAVLALVGILMAGYATYLQFDYSTGRIAYEPTMTATEEGSNIQQNFDSTRFALGYVGDGSVVVDNFAVVFRYIFLLGTALTILLSIGYLQREESARAEYYALLLFSTIGMMIMASAADLLTLFIGLETLSIPIYILAGYHRNQIRSNEAGLKYLLMGAFASGFFIYGIAFIYGATGTLRLRFIAERLAESSAGGFATPPFLLIGVALLFVGFAFKVAAVPFHMWTPDVYQGAPTAVTAYMSVAVKAAALAGLLRVLLVLIPFQALMQLLNGAIWWIAVLTMIFGNVIALAQDNIKRMLAYSSISHAGYLLVGVLAVMNLGTTPMAMASILYYLFAYTLMNIGAFAVVLLVARKGDRYEKIEDFAGLGKKHPALAAAMSLFLVSLAGIPPTAGFFGKFYLFGAAVSAGMIPLVVIAVLNSLISVAYYFRPIMAMYFRPAPEDDEQRGPIQIPYAAEFTLYFTATAVLLIGIIPNRIIPLVNSIISGL